ncbi:MAG: hypothetical protein WC178_00440 [Candidatus Paceibacterota bacterium]
MNKSLFASDADIPPLLMLSLAVSSLIINLCFPQYSALANTRKQRFTAETSSEESKLSFYTIKNEIEEGVKNETKSKIQSATEEQTFSELKLEKKIKIAIQTVSVPKVATAQPTTTEAGISSRWVTVTAYSSTVDQCDSNPFITASGTHVRDGVIATNLLSFGTKVKFPSVYGEKIFVVEDRMNQRYSDRADIWFETREQAKQFGVKRLEMVVVS